MEYMEFDASVGVVARRRYERIYLYGKRELCDHDGLSAVVAHEIYRQIGSSDRVLWP